MKCTGVKCISDDCLYYLPASKDGCCFKSVYLRKGTCRYYRKKTGEESIDRKDLPGDSYAEFVSGAGASVI